MRISDWSSDVCSSDLHSQDFTLHRIGDADAAGLGDRLAVFLHHHGTEHLLALAAAEQAVGVDALEHRGEHLREKEGLEFLPHAPRGLGRSEEHTSELQSLMRISYAVFCLKKKTKKST